MVYCNHCNNVKDVGQDSNNSCCWARALEIKKFKKHVLHKYIIEVLFDLFVSVCSVVTDIISLILYIKKGRWGLAVITAIPVLLPTLVFTNVYMADETQGYCKLPVHNKRSNRISESDNFPNSKKEDEATKQEGRFKQIHNELDYHCACGHFMCSSCHSVFRGLFNSLCNKDRHLRRRGAQLVRKSLKRLLKYFFGTFVLRFIAIAWYFKALYFGINAFREPKKFMKMEKPITHWSYQLLVRLDFLQAALENAPQCVVQLYVMLVYPDEHMVLALFTLIFSFVDFVRVCASVQWDLHRGPVIAPTGCYGSIFWKLLNITSWICLYLSRSAALALVIATGKGWTYAIPVIFFILHVVTFSKLFSKAMYGLAAQKLVVSVFISIFFLPELHSNGLPILVQFYLAVIHIENLFFITPWNGMDYVYCFSSFKFRPVPPTPGHNPKLNDSFISEVFNQTQNITRGEGIMESNFGSTDHCLIDPMIIVICVPVLTMFGIVLRLSASQRMSEFKKSLPKREENLLMEERVANIYSKKWSQMTLSQLSSAFLRMLRKEVITTDEKFITSDGQVYVVSETIQNELKKSRRFIHRAASFLAPEFDPKPQRSMSVDAYGINMRKNRAPEDLNNCGYCSDSHLSVAVQRSKFKNSNHWNLNDEVTSEVEVQSLPVSDTGLVRVDGPDGPYFLEMAWI